MVEQELGILFYIRNRKQFLMSVDVDFGWNLWSIDEQVADDD